MSVSARMRQVIARIKWHFSLTTVDSRVIFTASGGGVVDGGVGTLPQVLAPPVLLGITPTVVVLGTAVGVRKPLGGAWGAFWPPGGLTEG